MKKILLSLGLLLSAGISAQDCSELFISEYVEGWSNNKALELYNPTANAIDLSDYVLQRYSNGSIDAGLNYSVQLTGTIQPYDTYVAVLDKQDEEGTGQEAPVWDELQAKADGFYNNDYETSSVMYFNGNDAVVLAKGSTSNLNDLILVDIFGKIGQDPTAEGGGDYIGWSSDFPYVGAGKDVTKDHSLIRKNTVLKGVTNPNISFFDPLAEYDSIPAVVPMLDENGDPILDNSGEPRIEGNWFSLGAHDCECNELSINKESIIQLSIYPNPSANGVFNFATESNIVNIEVYSAVGQKVFSKENTSGIKEFTIGNKPGLYLVNIETANGVVTSRRVIVK